MKLRNIYDFILAIPAAFKASREEEQNRRLAGM